MKLSKIGLVLLIVIFGYSCKSSEPQGGKWTTENAVVKPNEVRKDSECIDKSKIDKKAPCTREYNPVCGCNEVTYPNPCEAKKNGVTTWKRGKCIKSAKM